MKLPISWLRDWVEFDAAPERLAEALTTRGFYVEGLEHHGHSYPGVVVARVLEVAKHPNADKLSLCRVDAGAGEVRVVCGAPNVFAGMMAPFATIGAKLPDGTTIRKSRIRGEESQGMLCSARELGLSDDHQGIVDLTRRFGANGGLTLGRPFEELLPPPDAVLEVEVPFNRPDGLGVVGLAREIKAALDARWTKLAERRLAAVWDPGRQPFAVTLEDAEGCPLYLAQAVEGIRVAPSPKWLADRLAAMGQRAISNVVDITNLVLFEFGQPLHAFDLAKLHGPEIRVRRARPGERITTLDGKDRALDPEVLVIADRDRPVAVAGVMGGAESEVGAATTSLLLECAWFEPRRVRRGSRWLGLATEASRRFERGVDPQVGERALVRFLELLAEVCPDSKPAGARHESRMKPERRELDLRISRLARLTGLALGVDEARARLASLQFGVRAGRAPGTLRVEVPSWRADVAIEDDLVEEVARAHGYDRIPEAPLETRGVYAVRSARERLVERARAAMLARGVTEALTTTLVSEAEALAAAALFGEPPSRLVRLANPMSRESEVLRPNPAPGLLRACAHNLRQGVEAVRLFEIGAGFLGREGGPPEEPLMLGALLAGPRFAHAHDAAQQPMDFADAKGVWDGWLDEMRVDTPEWRAYPAGGWKPGASAEVASGASRIAWAGTLGQPLLRAWEIEIPVHLLLVLLDPLSGASRAAGRVTLPGRFPPVRRDLAFFVPEGVTHRQLEAELSGTAGERLISIELFDVYAGPGTPQGMKSLACSLRFMHPERTLTESEVQAIQDRMVRAAAERCGARLRER